MAVIKVAGRHLVGDDVFCRIGHDDVSAMRVSSALAKCEAPAHAPGPVVLEVSTAPLPLHEGPMGEGRAGWDAILDFLQTEVHWLGRYNAVSVHRT